MEGTKHPSPSDRIVKVGRGFEWSRLERELMTSAYERVVPVGRSAQAKTLLAGREGNGSEFVRFDGGRQRYAAGA
jgi:hypothetical protein